MMSHTAARVFLLVVAGAVVAACGGGPAPAGAGDGAGAAPAPGAAATTVDETAADETAVGGTRTIKHVAGTTEVPAVAERVATTSEVVGAHLASTGLTPVAGPEDVDEWLQPYVEAGLLEGVDPTAIEQIGTGDEPNLERLAVIQPDLILVEDFYADQFPTLSEIAPTVVIERPSNAAWKSAFDRTVAAAGREAQAEEVRARYDALVAEIDPAATDLEVTFLRGAGPGAFRLDVLGGFGGSVAEEAGFAVDVGGVPPEEADEAGVEFSVEQLEVVDGGLLVTTTQAEGGPSSITELEANPLWQTIPAVADGRVLRLPQPIYNGGTYVAAQLLLEALADAQRGG